MNGGRGQYVRVYAVAVNGTRITFERPCGHRETVDYGKRPLPKRMSEWACKRMARWWSKENGGVTTTTPCRTCRAAIARVTGKNDRP